MNSSLNLKKHSNLALVYFLIIALLGTLLRFFFVVEIPFKYKDIVRWLHLEPIASYYLLLVVASLVLLIAILLLFSAQFRKTKAF